MKKVVKMSSGLKLPYDKPEMEFWPAEALNEIEATMSGGGTSGGGGGGGSGWVPSLYVYLVNAPNFLYNLAGHSAIVFQSRQGLCELYSFHPYDNETKVAAGSIAHAVSLTNFYDFMNQCRAGGILVSNGYTSWREEFKRALMMGVSDSQYTKMKRYAQSIAQDSPTYDFLKFNCQSFCNSTLYTVGIALRNFLGYPFDSIIPNYVFDTAKSASNVTSFQRIEFVR